jgi:hypothetical protein
MMNAVEVNEHSDPEGDSVQPMLCPSGEDGEMDKANLAEVMAKPVAQKLGFLASP